MTKHEETALVKFRNGIIGAAAVLVVGMVATGFTFYFQTKTAVSNNTDSIKEMKSAIKHSDPEQIGRLKYRMQKIEDKMEEVQVQVNSAIRVMESFKADQERKTDRMLELLIEIKRNQ